MTGGAKEMELGRIIGLTGGANGTEMGQIIMFCPIFVPFGPPAAYEL